MSVRDCLSRVLFACAGDTVQYEETLDALCDSVESYVLHLTAASLRVAHFPNQIRFADGVLALACDPSAQSAVRARESARQEIRRALSAA
jgi:hypothetical protein